jgi:hypothetical protein
MQLREQGLINVEDTNIPELPLGQKRNFNKKNLLQYSSGQIFKLKKYPLRKN